MHTNPNSPDVSPDVRKPAARLLRFLGGLRWPLAALSLALLVLLVFPGNQIRRGATRLAPPPQVRRPY